MSAENRDSEIDLDHYQSLIQHIEANAKRHPHYGPCDGLGEGGSCSECDKLRIALADAIRKEKHCKFAASANEIRKNRKGLQWNLWIMWLIPGRQ